jgi:NAD(P)-dependent dehydrogenase (short-subunit alcohol dehydrogenase family)
MLLQMISTMVMDSVGRKCRMAPSPTGRAQARSLTPLDGKVAIVTGAARGIGRAYALRLADLGADVAVLDVDLAGAAKFGEALEAASVADEIGLRGRRGLGIEVDLGDRAAAEAAVRQVQSTLGRVDILVNNAGGLIVPLERSQGSVMPDDDTRTILDANLHSMIFCTQAAVPFMRAQGGGVIVNIASTAATTTYAQGLMAHYAMAKAAVLHYTRHLAAELGPAGIRANCIAPGIIMTARVAAQAAGRNIGTAADVAAIPLGRLGMPEDCAGALEFLVTDLSAYVTGQCLSVCGGRVLTPS